MAILQFHLNANGEESFSLDYQLKICMKVSNGLPGIRQTHSTNDRQYSNTDYSFLWENFQEDQAQQLFHCLNKFVNNTLNMFEVSVFPYFWNGW